MSEAIGPGWHVTLLREGCWIAVHPMHPPRIIEGTSITELHLSPEQVDEVTTTIANGYELIIGDDGKITFSMSPGLADRFG